MANWDLSEEKQVNSTSTHYVVNNIVQVAYNVFFFKQNLNVRKFVETLLIYLIIFSFVLSAFLKL